jgi:DNA-binding response OmpR family regulator
MKVEKNVNPSSILIVDDNVKNLQVLGGYLLSEKLQVEFALDGLSALNWLKKKRFDLILLDIMMPGMDGYEVCSIIKKDPDNCEIPIIFITAITDSDSIIKGFDSGAVDYITKPFIQRELLIRVKTQLKINKSKEEIIHYLHEIEDRNRNINDSIKYAKSIQNAVLSKSDKKLKYLPEHFILYLPKDIVSGDFYWLGKVENKLIFAVMDCTGHGVPGALMSILASTLLNETVIHDKITQPDIILENLRLKVIKALGQKNGHGRVKDAIEGCVFCFDPQSNILQYAGSFNPLILINGEEITTLINDRIPIGYFEIQQDFTLRQIELKKNDTIYLFSDGINDQFGGPKDKKFMIRQLKEILLANQNSTMNRQKEILTEKLNNWKGDSVQTDDILVFGIRFE